jgi:dihydrofolate reductase
VEGKDLSLAGGAMVVQQYLAAGLLDEMQIHLVPVLLGAGVRLLDGLGGDQVTLEVTRAVHSPWVSHLRYRAVK